MKFLRLFPLLMLVHALSWCVPADAQDKEVFDPLPAKYSTGYVPPDPAVKAAQIRRTGWVRFPHTTVEKWDCRKLGLVAPVRNQANCGSCWDFAGTAIVTSALIKAGHGKADGSFFMSEQYIIDCEGSNGGCNGDDHSTVLNQAKKVGMPTDADYGPYQARRGRCKPMTKLLKIEDWGYCDPGARGPADTQKIKDAMVMHGPISVAIAADGAFSNSKPGVVFKGRNNGINHEVNLVGWDDSLGAWILKNSWGTDWCDGGYSLIAYGANGVGTDAVWCTATPLPPPPGPTPPTPGQAPAITSSNLAHAQVGQPFSFQVAATNNPTTFGAAGLPPGLTITAASGLVSGSPTLAGAFTVTVSATNASGTGVGTLTVQVSGPGPGPTPGDETIITVASGGLAAGTYKIVPANAVVVTPDMTLADVIKLLDGKKTANGAPVAPFQQMPKGPCCEEDKRLDDVKRAVDALLKWALTQEQKK